MVYTRALTASRSGHYALHVVRPSEQTVTIGERTVAQV